MTRARARTMAHMPTSPTDISAAVASPAAGKERLHRRRSVAEVLTQFVLPVVGLALLAFAGGTEFLKGSSLVVFTIILKFCQREILFSNKKNSLFDKILFDILI
jgi:hypothetical protein